MTNRSRDRRCATHCASTISQELLEPPAVELPGRAPERRIASDPPHNLGVVKAEAHLPRALVEAGLGDHFAKHLPVETDGFGLFRRERMADLAADPLHALVIGLAKLLDRNFGATNLGERRAAVAAENVVDAPDRKAQGQDSHDDAHHGAAEPIRGGFTNTSKHCVQRVEVMPIRMPGGSGAS